MLVGVNATSPATFARCDELWQRGNVDYIELMLDNFVHLDPDAILERLDGRPVSIHIMSSMFLHKDRDELDRLARAFRRITDAISPLYISDHLGLHELDGRRVPEMIDVDYDDATLFDRCAVWQDALGSQLYLENYASQDATNGSQVRFFEELERRTGIRVLLDLSNAVIAELNGGSGRASDWLTADVSIDACHISGFTVSAVDPSLYVDSHDARIDDRSWALLDRIVAVGREPLTLTAERDGPSSMSEWAADLDLAAVRR